MNVSDTQLVRFAAQRVRRALMRTKVAVTPRAYRHLVGVVCLPVRDELCRGLAVHEPLTQWHRLGLARPLRSPERAALLGIVGDVTLLICGFWWQERSLQRTGRELGDLMDLGRDSYRNIGDEPYEELAAKYSGLADALTVMEAHYGADRDERVVALCESWRRHHDPRAARILAHLGLPAGLLDPGRPS
jgi:hypothetical protein